MSIAPTGSLGRPLYRASLLLLALSFALSSTACGFLWPHSAEQQEALQPLLDARRDADDADPYARPWDRAPRVAEEGAYQPEIKWKRLIVLHTNDLQGQLYAAEGKGGLAQLAGQIARERRRAKAIGAEVLLVDAGDVFSGSPLDGDRGEAMIEFMNRVGYDAMTVGVEDYEHGAEHLMTLAAKAQFPLLGANVVSTRTGVTPSRIQPVHIVRRGPLRVALTGLVTPRANEAIPASRRGDHRFSDPAGALQEVVGRLNGMEPLPNALILLNHQGVDEDVELAERLRGFSLVISGASETTLAAGGAVGEFGQLLLATTSGRARCLGRVELIVTVDESALLDSSAKVVDLDAAATPPDPRIARWVESLDPGRDGSGGPLSTLARPLTRAPLGGHAGPASSTLGNAVCDAMVAAGQEEAPGRRPELALFPRADLQGDLDTGPVDRRKLDSTIAGAGQELLVVELEGRTLRALVGRMIAGANTLLEVSSAVRVGHDMGRPAEDRLQTLTVAGQSDSRRVYRVAMTRSLAGHPLLEGAKATPMRKVVSLRDALRQIWSAGDPDQKVTEQVRIAPVAAVQAQEMLLALPTTRDEAAALYNQMTGVYSAAKASGVLRGGAPGPIQSVEQLNNEAVRNDVIVLVGKQYQPMLAPVCERYAKKHVVLISLHDLGIESVPANATVVRLADPKAPAFPEATQRRLIELFTGKPAGKVLDLTQ